MTEAAPFDRTKLVINRKRFSITQGEVELIYDGERIEQYGDTFTITKGGAWVGEPDDVWERVAARELMNRAEAQARKSA